jgi:protein O-mannosyl-transferase
MTRKQRAKDQNLRIHRNGWERPIPAWFSCLLISVVGLLAYSNTFESSFHFDDQTSVLHNAAIRNLSDFKSVFYYSPSRFLTYLTFALNYRLGGQAVLGYHVANLAMHLLASMMVWALARQVLRTPALKDSGSAGALSLLPLFAGLVFVAHPVQTQAVTYIVQRAASLATFFFLVSLYCYGEGRRRQVANSNAWATVGFYAGAFVAAIGAGFSKETAFSLPFAVVLYEVFFFKKPSKITWAVIGVFSSVVLLLPLYLISRNLVSATVLGAIPVKDYLLTQPRVWLTYLRLVIFPVDQNIDYDFTISRSLFDVSVLLSIAGLAAVAFAGARMFRFSRVLSFGVFWFMLTLLPESSILPLPDVIYEHRIYLPMVGLSLVAAFAIQRLTCKWGTSGVAALMIGIVAALGLTSYMRNKVWTDEVTLWQDVIKKSPGKARGYLNLGRAYDDLGMYNQAKVYYDMAQVRDPAYGDTYASRANMLVHQGSADEAIVECNRALGLISGLAPQTARIYFNRGTAYLMKNLLDSALADLSNAISYDPNLEQAYFNRAIAFARQSKFQNAVEDYSRSLVLEPGKSNALNNRGVILRDLGKLDEALADFKNALLFKPDFPEAYFNRAMTYGMKGDFDKGIEDYTSFIRLVPRGPEGYFGRGTMFFRKGEHQKAVSEFSRALEFNSSYGPAYAGRAKALSAVGEKAAAAADVKRAQALGSGIDKPNVSATKKSPN